MKYVSNTPMITYVGGPVEQPQPEIGNDNSEVNETPILNEKEMSEENENVLETTEKIEDNKEEIFEEKTDENLTHTAGELVEKEIETDSEIEKKPILKKLEEKLTEATNWSQDSVKLWVFNFKNKSERAIFLAFILPPVVISIISMIHVVSFFELSNNSFLSWMLAAAFEFASISALFALTALTKIKKNTIWTLFFAIVLTQVIGNMYHSYIHINPSDPNLLKLFSIIGIEAANLIWTQRILGFLQGGILPIISLSFVKAIVEYLNVNREEKK